MALDRIQKALLKQIADIESIPAGAYNLRINGKSTQRNSTANIEIIGKEDKSGIDIYIKPGTKNERVEIPVLITDTGITEKVYNDFHVGADSDVVIVAGCGIHNCGNSDSEHDGIHSFFLDRGARVKYIERHYGEGDGDGKRLLNPETRIFIDEDGYMEMETSQIKGVDSTYRKTYATLEDRATLIIHEKIMTHGNQTATTDFTVDLDGVDSGAHVVSRSVARDDSHQLFISCVDGNNRSNGHTECDAIIMDNASVSAVPKVTANHPEASLIHEAAIGKIAGEQLTKLMTLGLTEKEAEEEIIAGFLC